MTTSPFIRQIIHWFEIHLDIILYRLLFINIEARKLFFKKCVPFHFLHGLFPTHFLTNRGTKKGTPLRKSEKAYLKQPLQKKRCSRPAHVCHAVGHVPEHLMHMHAYSESTMLRAIHTPAAPAWARPRVMPAPSPPQYSPLISVSSVSDSFGRAE